jgi:hypothetical protein
MLVKDLSGEWERVRINLLVLLNNVMGKPVYPFVDDCANCEFINLNEQF